MFVKGYVGAIAKWKALYVIFADYFIALAQVSKRMAEAMEQSLSADRKIQWQLASRMAGELKEKLNVEIADVQ